MTSVFKETKSVLLDTSARPAAAVGAVSVTCLLCLFACIASTKSMMLTGYAYMGVFDMLMVGTVLVTLWVRKQRPSFAFSYGYERFEVLAVFASTVLCWLGALFVVKESVERMLQQPDIHTDKLLFGTAIALFSHMVVIYGLRNDAFKHVIVASSSSWLQEHVADISQTLCRFIPPLSSLLLPRVNPFSLLAISGAFACLLTDFLIKFEGYHAADTIAALCFAVMMIGTMYPMSLYTGKILLQTTPSHVIAQLDKCLREASTLDGVLEFTHEHFWQLSFGQLAGSVHFRVRRDADEQLVLAHVTDKLSQVVSKLTVQIVKDADWYTISGGHHDPYATAAIAPAWPLHPVASSPQFATFASHASQM